MIRPTRWMALCAAGGMVVAVVGCGGGGGGATAPDPARPGDPLTVNNVTATPAAGESLRSTILSSGGPPFGVVIWGGSIGDLRMGMAGASRGDIVFASGTAGHHDLKTVDSTTRTIRTAVDTQYDVREPTWIEEGSRIAYEMIVGNDTDIYAALPDGQGQQVIVRHGSSLTVDERQPSGKYVGDEVLYVADYNGDTRAEIYKSDTDGASAPSVVLSGAVKHKHPSYAPGVWRYVYVTDIAGPWDLGVAPIGVGPPTAITSGATPEDEPEWSPDGSRIAYSKRAAGNWDIYVCNADGSGGQRLTANAAQDRHPSWSPDGRQIVFSSERSGNGDIYVMNADGTSETKLVGGTDEDIEPEWSAAAERSRTFVGPAGSDGGSDPPFGTQALQVALLGGGRYGGVMFGLRCQGAASAVQVVDLNETIEPYMIGVSIHTPGTITVLGEDTGRGRPTMRHIRRVGSAPFVGDFNNVILMFEGTSAQVSAIIPWQGPAKAKVPLGDSPLAAKPTIKRKGHEIRIQGARLGRPGGGYCREIILDAMTGEVIRAR